MYADTESQHEGSLIRARRSLPESDDLSLQLFEAIKENEQRLLIENQVFFSDLFSCVQSNIKADHLKNKSKEVFPKAYKLIRSLMHAGEHQRVIYEACKVDHMISPRIRFLYFYARYLKVIEDMKTATEDVGNNLRHSQVADKSQLLALLSDLNLPAVESKNDAFLFYLKALIYKQLEDHDSVVAYAIKSVNKYPFNWSAWKLLVKMVDSKGHLEEINTQLNSHWLKSIFIADVKCHLLQCPEDDVVQQYEALLVTFKDNTYLLGQIALVHEKMRQVNKSLQMFEKIRELDPFSMSHMDIYSNLLYVSEMKVELTYLAHELFNTNKYTKETCAVMANFYSLRGQHDKAIEYYKRALRLDDSYALGWTLMGHECVEMKDTQAAINAYKRATEINKNDYHAWYGLGQLFEVLEMPLFALKYHQAAYSNRPTDSRALVAMGDCYAKIEQFDEAKHCYCKAYQTGDIEGMVLHKLAKIHEQLNEKDWAREYYQKFLNECEYRLIPQTDEHGDAYLYLSRANLERGDLDTALLYAQQCLNFPQRREESKMIIKEIAAKRSSVPDINIFSASREDS